MAFLINSLPLDIALTIVLFYILLSVPHSATAYIIETMMFIDRITGFQTLANFIRRNHHGQFLWTEYLKMSLAYLCFVRIYFDVWFNSVTDLNVLLVKSQSLLMPFLIAPFANLATHNQRFLSYTSTATVSIYHHTFMDKNGLNSLDARNLARSFAFNFFSGWANQVLSESHDLDIRFDELRAH